MLFFIFDFERLLVTSSMRRDSLCCFDFVLDCSPRSYVKERMTGWARPLATLSLTHEITSPTADNNCNPPPLSPHGSVLLIYVPVAQYVDGPICEFLTSGLEHSNLKLKRAPMMKERAYKRVLLDLSWPTLLTSLL